MYIVGFLEFYKSVSGKDAEIVGSSVAGESLRSGTGVLEDKVGLKHFDIFSFGSVLEISVGEGQYLRKEGFELGYEGYYGLLEGII